MNGYENRVPLTKVALDILSQAKARKETHKINSSYVFPSPRNYTKQQFSTNNAIRALREELGFHFTPHDLRRTAVTHLAKLGVSTEVRRRIVNHVSGDVHQVYDRYDYQKEKRLALDKWANWLRGLGTELRVVK